ncbi:MAG: DUF5309 domain-containing protein [Acidobacteria bacterium]|nr:DUF5309 domain-containing protein [Acidobacteriota bacterium]
MAIPTNTVVTANQIGRREDLVEAIYQISPEQTPFLSAAVRVKATGILHEWQTDALEAAAENRKIEGDDATANTFNPTVRLNNHTQISSKTISVSRTSRAVNAAGRADEFSYQLSQKGKELKLDMEFALVREQASSAGSGTVSRASAGLESWLASNKTSVGTGTAQTTPGFASGAVVSPTDSTVTGAFTKASLDDVIQKCWSSGGNPTEIMCGPTQRVAISGFSGISTLQTPASPDSAVTLMGAVDFYKSNFGTLRVVPSRVQRDRTVLVLDMDFVAVAMLDDMTMEPLGKTGDSDKTLLVAEFCLEMKNEAASGKVTDCT